MSSYIYINDSESGLYYLQSRYYDPEIGRFINADSFASTGQGLLGNNMFAYCMNNPVNLSDQSGAMPFYDHPFIRDIENIIQWYGETDENEKDSNGEYTLNAKVKRTVQAIEKNLGFVGGIGLGISLEVSASEYVNAEIGIHYDLARIEFINGKFDAYQYYFQGATANVFSAIIDQTEEARRPIDGRGEWEIIDGQETLSLYGLGGYFFGGFTVEIYFDIIALCDSIDEIWRN